MQHAKATKQRLPHSQRVSWTFNIHTIWMLMYQVAHSFKLNCSPLIFHLSFYRPCLVLFYYFCWCCCCYKNLWKIRNGHLQSLCAFCAPDQYIKVSATDGWSIKLTIQWYTYYTEKHVALFHLSHDSTIGICGKTSVNEFELEYHRIDCIRTTRPTCAQCRNEG